MEKWNFVLIFFENWKHKQSNGNSKAENNSLKSQHLLDGLSRRLDKLEGK